MSSTSPNFNLVLATASDIVSVDSHVAGPISTIDTILGQVHTGTGQLKTGLVVASPTLVSPVLSGTMTGGTIVATVANIQSITGTATFLRVNTLQVGTYNIVGTIGNTNEVLSVVTGNAVWRVISNTGTGADTNLANLASVAINTSLNTFTAGFITCNRVIATSGALTGLTVFQASTGTFAGNLLVSGTATVNVVNCTGGTITAGGFSIGTYSYPATVGSTGQILRVTTGNLVFASQSAGAAVIISTTAAISALNSNTHMSLTIAASKLYELVITYTNGAGNAPFLAINGATGPTDYELAAVGALTNTDFLAVPLVSLRTTAGNVGGHLRSRIRINTHNLDTDGAVIWGDTVYKDTANDFQMISVAGVYNVNSAATSVSFFLREGTVTTGSLVLYEYLTTT